jgi:AraC-like DNA-binding protein
MSVDYQEWPPGPALNGVILAYWRVVGDGSSVPSPMILPDAYVEVVLNLGAPVTLVGPAFTGIQPARSIVGLLETAIEIQYGAEVHTFGIRLHAARAAGFLGVPARTLANTLGPLAHCSETLDQRLLHLVDAHPSLETVDGRSALDACLIEHLRQARPSDELVQQAVDRMLGADVPVTVAGLAREFGVSPRHLQRRFLSATGMSPKRLERVARFARVWQQATFGPPLTWADLAVANGYADQSHLVREFRAFGAKPPAHLFTAEWYETTTVARAKNPPNVRSVQDPREAAAQNRRVTPDLHPPAKRRT